MGQLVDGKWVTDAQFVKDSDGRFRRKAVTFRNWIKADGSTPFTPEAGRYHLYIANACPWAHRTMVFRKLRGLEEAITISIVDTLMLDNGWQFNDAEGYIPDTVNGKTYLYEVYQQADSNYSGRVTVPILWDKQTETIVNNESSEIIRMFNSEFAAIAKPGTDYYPAHLQAEIDEINERVYHTVNNGVYKSGFARTQIAYEEAVIPLFETLDFLEDRLASQRYLVGDQITEADWRLFTTLVRFDPVYVGHFKCNLRKIEDYHNLSNYLRDLYQQPGVADTVNLPQIKEHYYRSHESVNPTGVVPIGPIIDYSRPHDRDKF
ncbi:MAG: glutathione S-transferase family protein [Chloroflexota bacterium]